MYATRRMIRADTRWNESDLSTKPLPAQTFVEHRRTLGVRKIVDFDQHNEHDQHEQHEQHNEHGHEQHDKHHLLHNTYSTGTDHDNQQHNECMSIEKRARIRGQESIVAAYAPCPSK